MGFMLNDTIIGFIRTYVPVGVGVFLTWLGQATMIDIDRDGAVALAVGIVIALYYLVARLLVKIHPVFGWLLGNPHAPQYTAPTVLGTVGETNLTYKSNDD